ncbi:MAG TPA: aminotransferase class I/II-fold pyridoxal phosphate-dependent enzyme [Bacteroidales bacterium]|nr:aminotransferase class I/II-fold pyridoxal phosphate-dependent enzyme [Bacteroidales bacterium]
MASNLDKAYDPDLFRRMGHQLVDMLADYLESLRNGTKMPVYAHKDPDERVKEFETDFSVPEDDLNRLFKRVLEESIHIHHPGYLGHQVSPPLPVTVLSGMMSQLLNNGAAVYEMGAVSVAMEKTVMRFMAQSLGLADGADGIFTSGGSMGNLTAMLALRQFRSGYNVWEDGVDGESRIGILMSEDVHYSIPKAIQIMGLGDEAVIRVPVGSGHKLTASVLEKYFYKTKSEGIKPVAVVAGACNTATGTYDPLSEIAEFCQKFNLWFHVDAAHGGAAIFSEKHAERLKGIEHADSIVIDFHKMMLVPALNTLVLFKNGDKSFQTFSQHASYLFEKNKVKEWYNMAGRTLECTKNMMGFQAYTALKSNGAGLIGSYVDTTYELATQFASKLAGRNDFELPLQPESNIICFRFVQDGQEEDRLNEMNAFIRKTIVEEGEYYLVQTMLDKKLYLRLSLMNPFTSIQDLDNLIERITEKAKKAGFI